MNETEPTPLKINGLTFDEWWVELNRLAEVKGCECLLSPSKLDHLDGWREGYTPDEELHEQASAASG